MMKKTVLSASLIFLCIMAFTQNPLIRKDIILKTGIGISNKGMPIYLGIDYGLTNEMSIGGEFSNNIDRSMTTRAFKVRWDYHFKKFLVLREHWDIYAGVGLGYYMYQESGPREQGPDLSAQVGISYFVSYKFGIMAEYGAGNAFTGPRLGVALKF